MLSHVDQLKKVHAHRQIIRARIYMLPDRLSTQFFLKDRPPMEQCRVYQWSYPARSITQQCHLNVQPI